MSKYIGHSNNVDIDNVDNTFGNSNNLQMSIM